MFRRNFSLSALWRGNGTQQNAVHAQPPSMDQIFKIALLLRALPLPADVIPDILDYAGLWCYVNATTNPHSQLINERNAGVVHSATAIPAFMHPGSVRSVVFRTISHDQGWSWDRDSHGTYGGSCTWFEAGILVPQVSVPTLQNCRRIITNIHASKVDKEHRVEWFHDDPDPYIQLIFRQLRSGESVGINVCASYLMWQNLVKESSIGFTFQPVRKVP
jgi:hypothetical protein